MNDTRRAIRGRNALNKKLQNEQLEARLLLASDLSVAINDGSSVSFPGVATAYSIEITNDGPDNATSTNIVHKATQGHGDVSWNRTIVPGGIPFQPEINLNNLNGARGFSVSGEGKHDQSGRSVRWAGDVNADGIDDAIIGAHLANTNGVDAGQAMVVFGSADNFPASIDANSLNGTNGFLIAGSSAADYFSFSVSGAGDVNNDGIDDLIVGARQASSNSVVQNGAAFVIFGMRDIGRAGVVNVSSLDGSDGFRIHGVDAYNRFGESVIGLGDVNEDGIDDILISSVDANPNGIRSGAAYVVFGRSEIGFRGAINLKTLDGDNGFVIRGISERDNAGSSVNRAGDVNRDGINDLIVGAMDADPVDQHKTGEAYVIFGGADIGGNGSIGLADLQYPIGLTFSSGIELEQTGASVSEAGDINHDGIDDLIIGAPNATIDETRTKAGKVYVVFGTPSLNSLDRVDLSKLDGQNGFVIHGEEANGRFGGSVSSADINGDGISDLLIGAESSRDGAGSAYVLLGREGIGTSGTIELAELDGLNGFVMRAPDTRGLGVAISRAGDLNQDGIEDLIVGSNRTNTPVGSEVGKSFIVFGRGAPARSIVTGRNDINQTLDIPVGTHVTYEIQAMTQPAIARMLLKTVSASFADDLATASDFNAVSNDRPVVQFSHGTYELHENGQANGHSITLTRTGNLDVSSSVRVNAVGSGASPASHRDFDGTPLNVVFLPGETSRQITLTIEQDLIREPIEFVELSITAVDLAAIGAQAKSQLKILDDDVAQLTVRPVEYAGGPTRSGASTLEDGDAPLVFEIKMTSEPTDPVNLRFSMNPTNDVGIDNGVVSTFHIGNSLTEDARPDLFSHTVGYHLDFGKSLNHIRNNPNDADETIDPFGAYLPALDEYDWEFVTVQPFPGSTSNLTSDVSFIQQIQAIEPEAEILLFEPWPDLVNKSYAESWNKPLSLANPPFTDNSAAYYAALEAELNHVGVAFRAIPVGAILFAIDQEARAGKIPTINSAEELYREQLHLSDNGRAVAYSAMYYAIYGELPTTIPFEHSLSPAALNAINVQIVRVSPDPQRDPFETSLAFNAQNWQLPQYVTAGLEKLPTKDTTFALSASSNSRDSFYDKLWNVQQLASIDVTGYDQFDTTTGLVAHWDFEGDYDDEAVLGSMADDGSPRNQTTLVPGGIGQSSANFDGDGDLIEIPNSGDINRETIGEYSISLWFNGLSVRQAERQVIYEQGGGNRGFNIYLENGSLVAGAWDQTQSWSGTWISTPVSTAEWHHVSLVLNANANHLSLFVDGAFVGNGFGTQIGAHNAARIGAANEGTRFFDPQSPGFVAITNAAEFAGFLGQIDDVRIYHRAIELADVARLASDSPRTSVDLVSDLVAHWKFDRNGSDSAPFGSVDDHATLVATSFSSIGFGSGSLALDGQFSFASIASSADINEGDRPAQSVSLRFRASDLDSPNRQVIYRQGGRARGINVYLENGSVYMGAWNDDSGADAYSGNWVSHPVAANQWTYVAIVVDGAAQKMTGYVNGIAIGTKSAGPFRSHNSTTIGAARKPSRYASDNELGYELVNQINSFAGNIDEVRVYRGALSDAQVIRLAVENPDFAPVDIASARQDDDGGKPIQERKDLEADAMDPILQKIDLVFAETRPLFDIETPKQSRRDASLTAWIA